MAIIDLEEYARKFDLEHYVGTDNTQVNSIQIMKDLGIWSDAFCYDVRETMPYSYMVRVAEIMVSQDNPDEDVLESLCPDLRDNKQVVLAAVKKYGSSLRYASKRLRDDRDVVYAAVSKHGYALEYASKRLRDDRDIVWAAFKVGRGSLSFSSKRLLNDRNFMLDAVRIDKLCLVHASEEVQDDKEIILAALDKSSEWVEKFKEEQQHNSGENTSWIRQQIRKDALILDVSSEDMRDDEDVIMGAVKYYDEPLKCASERIRNLVSSLEEGNTVFEKLERLKMTHYKSARK